MVTHKVKFYLMLEVDIATHSVPTYLRAYSNSIKKIKHNKMGIAT